MKKIIVSILIVLIFPALCLAAEKVNWKKVDSDARAVATGDEIPVYYMTGLPDIDSAHKCFTYDVRLKFEESDIVLLRNMIDQKKGKGVEEVEVARIRYADIKDLLFGYDAIYASQEEALPTAQKLTCQNQQLTMVLQIMKSPVAILFDKDGKRISFVVTAPDQAALALYRGLADRAKLKVKTPLAYRGIVKQRAKLDPPPPEGER